MEVLEINYEDLPKNTKTPYLTHCRRLIEEGHPEDTKINFFKEGRPALVINHLGKASKITVLENEREGPRLVRHKGFIPTGGVKE